jgi:hypothetical protein
MNTMQLLKDIERAGLDGLGAGRSMIVSVSRRVADRLPEDLALPALQKLREFQIALLDGLEAEDRRSGAEVSTE